jgi:hypothetical protein
MKISDLPFLEDINEHIELVGGSKKKLIKIKRVVPQELPPGVPPGSTLTDMACTQSIPASCNMFYTTPSGETVTAGYIESVTKEDYGFAFTVNSPSG